jgi:hypothetical protein
MILYGAAAAMRDAELERAQNGENKAGRTDTTAFQAVYAQPARYEGHNDTTS